MLEVGMGGRLDATNVVEPLVSVIADISLDHQKFLGNTVGEIAREKVGIIRPGGVVVTLPQQPEANDVIGNTILDLGARGVSAVQYVPPVSPGSGEYLVPSRERRVYEPRGIVPYRYPLQVMGKQILVESPLVGRHQLRNVALAVAAAEELTKQGIAGITPQSIERGIRETRWPGRFQVLPARLGWPEIVLDVAHNPAGAWALRSALSERYDDRPLIFVFGAMRDKAISEMTEILFPLAATGDCHAAGQSEGGVAGGDSAGRRPHRGGDRSGCRRRGSSGACTRCSRTWERDRCNGVDLPGWRSDASSRSEDLSPIQPAVSPRMEVCRK